MLKYAAIFAAIIFSSQMAFAESSISTSKDAYSYGDHLTFIISVSKVTKDAATIHIVGPDGIRSSAIPVQIKNTITTITAPNPFSSEIFKEGRYQIEMEYDGEKSSAEFSLTDSGNMVLPIGSNVVIGQWSAGGLSDYSLLKFLTDNKMIEFQGSLKNSVNIPEWYMGNAQWWLDKKITDAEFLNGMQYLINEKIVS